MQKSTLYPCVPQSLNIAWGAELSMNSEKPATRMEKVLDLISTEHMNPEEKTSCPRNFE